MPLDALKRLVNFQQVGTGKAGDPFVFEDLCRQQSKGGFERPIGDQAPAICQETDRLNDGSRKPVPHFRFRVEQHARIDEQRRLPLLFRKPSASLGFVESIPVEFRLVLSYESGNFAMR